MPFSLFSCKPVLILLYLLAVNMAGGKKEKEIVHRIQVTGNSDLVFKEKDNPCKVIKKYCKSLSSSDAVVTYDHCFVMLHTHATLQLGKLWAALSTKLKVGYEFFIDCQPLAVARSDFEEDTTVVGTTRNSTGLVGELLGLLDRARNRDTDALAQFNAKRYEYDFTDWERWMLYSTAMLMLPSNLFIVDQFGLCLLYGGFEVQARKVFKNAVERGLWGNPMQRPVSKYVPGLTAKPWHNKEDYSFIKILEEGTDDVRSELEQNLRENPSIFTGEMENLHVGGEWVELRLKSSGRGFTEHTPLFPRTMSVIKRTHQEFTSIKFSAIRPGTHIRTHTGPTNERLRVHLTLLHKGGARIRVSDKWYTWEEGKAIIFDDSFEHEVLHTGDELRAVLIMDIWHPELPEKDRIIY
jgi:hypothetical protein